jgi:Tol biopolymer transport system component
MHGGRLKILDFGLAKVVDMAEPAAARSNAPTTTVTTTRIGQIIGTAAYMSPEQIRGDDLDPRSDIFSFGCVLYEMLTGKRPFDRPTSFETMAATLNEEPPAVDHLDLPPELVLALRRCLEKDRDDRFQSARDLAFQFSSLDTAVFSRATVRGRRRLPSRLTGRAVAVVVGAALAGAGIFLAGIRAGRTSPPVYQQLTFRRGDILSARFTPDGHTIVYGAAWDGKAVQLSSTRLDGTESRTLGLPDGDVLAISSTGEMAISLGRRYVASHAARGTLARLSLDAASAREVLVDVEQADWSPDGRTLAIARLVGGRYRLEYPIGRVLYEATGWISRVRISPDGARVAFADHPVYGDDRGSICVIATSGGNRQVLSDGWTSVTGLAWSRNGGEVWFTAADVGSGASLRAVNLAGRLRLILPAPGRLALQDIDAAGRVLLTSSKYRARIGSTDSSGKEHDWSWLDGSIATDLSNDGSRLLFTEQNTGSGTSAYAVYLRTTDGSPATRIGEGSDALLSPDGRWAAAVVLGPPEAVVLLPTSAGEPRALPNGTLNDYQAATWFPDGQRLLLASAERGHRVRLWEQTLAGAVPTPVSIEGLRIAGSSRPISPDGRYAVALDEADHVWLQPLTGAAAERLDRLDPGDIPIRWDADGTSFYLFRTGELPGTVQRYRVTDRVKQPVARLAPADPAGVSGLLTVHTTADGKTFFYTYTQALSDLYIVSNLR